MNLNTSWELLVVVRLDEDDVVNEGSNTGTGEWAQPVDPVVGPGPADDGWAKRDGWVHGGSVEGTASQDVGANNETDSQGCNDANVSLLGVNGCGVHSVDQSEGHHDLEHQGVPDGHAGGQAECSGGLQ